MPDDTTQVLKNIVERFRVGGEVTSVEPLGSGHIHDTYASTVLTAAGTARFVHQRINRSVFPSPERLQENVVRVTSHLRRKIAAEGGDPERETLTVVPTRDGGNLHEDSLGESWRTFRFVENARTLDVPGSPKHAYEIAAAFGRFLRRVADLPGPRLHETIPGFGDTRARIDAFREALEADRLGRAAAVGAEVEFVRAREGLAAVLPTLLEQRLVPERIVHHDTKVDNVLIDEDTGRGICVIDLDTVMPGSVLHDFGDMVRLGATRAAEDEKDLSLVSVDEELFEGLVRGYMDEAGPVLTAGEIEHLVEAARITAFVVGVRFLTDHLAGDTYFRILREGHNLDRCRVQFALVRDLEEKADRLRI
jgi:Ser/Thr protein kinase RdoA (MazF antagonist)